MANLNLEDYKSSVYEPKVCNRWVITLPEEFGIPSWAVHATQRPTIIFSHSNKNNPIKIKFYDPIGESTTRAFWEISVGYGVIYGDNIIHPETKLKLVDKFQKFRLNGFDYNLEMLDPVGGIIESWTIKGCKILEIDFGELDYSNDKPVECSMTVQPKNVILNF